MVPDHLLQRLIRSPRLVRLYGDLIRVAVAAVVLGWIAAAVTWHVVVGQFMFDRLHMNDFGKFYYSARAFLAGGDMYGPSPATRIAVGLTETREFWNLNPPHFHILILPFTWLPEAVAILAWAMVNLGALVVTLRIIAKELGIRWTLPGALWTLAAAVSCSVTGMVVVTGQITCLLMLAATIVWRAARHGHWSRAGAWLGLMASVKPFIGLFVIYLLLTRRWRALGMMAASVVAAFVLGTLVFGWAPQVRWVQVLASVTWPWAPMNGSLNGILHRAFSETPFYTPLTMAGAWILPLGVVLALSCAVAALLPLRSDRSPDATDRGVAAVLLTAQVISPLGWFYYVLTGLGPLAALVRARPGRRSRGSRLAFALAVPGLLLPLTATMIGRTHPLGGVTWGSLYGWTTLLLWMGVLLDARAARVQPPPDGSLGA